MNIYAERLDKLRQIMKDVGAKYLILFGPEYGRYLCGYEPIFGDFMLLADLSHFRLFLRFDWDIPRVPDWIDRADILASYDFATDLVPFLAGQHSIAVAGGERMPHRLYRAIEMCGDICPIDSQAMSLRLIKDAEEISAIRQAVTITEEALEATLCHLAPGITEAEVAARFEYEVKCRGAELAFPSIVASGIASQKVASLPTKRVLQQGDILMFDVGARFEGYCADLSRTVAIGAATDAMHTLYDRLMAVHLASIDFVKPGIPACDCHTFTQRQFDQNGWGTLRARLGHGVGIETSMEGPDLRTDTILLRPGMSFCIEMQVDGDSAGDGVEPYGIKLEDDLLVTERGREIISHPWPTLREV